MAKQQLTSEEKRVNRKLVLLLVDEGVEKLKRTSMYFCPDQTCDFKMSNIMSVGKGTRNHLVQHLRGHYPSSHIGHGMTECTMVINGVVCGMIAKKGDRNCSHSQIGKSKGGSKRKRFMFKYDVEIAGDITEEMQRGTTDRPTEEVEIGPSSAKIMRTAAEISSSWAAGESEDFDEGNVANLLFENMKKDGEKSIEEEVVVEIVGNTDTGYIFMKEPNSPTSDSAVEPNSENTPLEVEYLLANLPSTENLEPISSATIDSEATCNATTDDLQVVFTSDLVQDVGMVEITVLAEADWCHQIDYEDEDMVIISVGKQGGWPINIEQCRKLGFEVLGELERNSKKSADWDMTERWEESIDAVYEGQVESTNAKDESV